MNWVMLSGCHAICFLQRLILFNGVSCINSILIAPRAIVHVSVNVLVCIEESGRSFI